MTETPIEYQKSVENSREKRKAQKRFAAQEFRGTIIRTGIT